MRKRRPTQESEESLSKEKYKGHKVVYLRRKLTAGYLPPPNIGMLEPTSIWISSKVHRIFRTKSFLRPFNLK